VTSVLAVGSGWGAAELELRGRQGWRADALPFPAGDASRLLTAVRTDDHRTLDELGAATPVPPVSDRWRRLLEARPGHWWTRLALGVAADVTGDPDRAEWHYRESAAARPTAGALLGLARAALRRGELDVALGHLDRAVAAAPTSRAVVTELLEVLLDAGRHDQMLSVLESLPGPLRRHGRTRLLEALARARSGDVPGARAIVDDLVVEDLAEGERALDELWEEISPGQPLPARLDFRMDHQPEEA